MATPSGERAIGSLQVGDSVEAYNPTTGKAEAESIQHVWLNHDHDLVDVHLTLQQAANADATASETVHTTVNHPWLIADQGWVQAGDLRLGEAVITRDGRT